MFERIPRNGLGTCRSALSVCPLRTHGSYIASPTRRQDIEHFHLDETMFWQVVY